MADQLVADGSLSFEGGQDGSKSPHLCPPNAYFGGINVSTEDGTVRPRWGLERHSKLSFPEGGIKKRNTNIKSFSDIFFAGKFQALASYVLGSDYYLVTVISGQIFFINERTLEVQHIPLEGEQINSRAPRINWEPAGRYLVLHDFPAFPVIIEGVSARRADPAKQEIPVSNIGGYNQNRLFVGNAGNEFTAGDPIGSSAAPNAPITFQEFLQIGSPFFGQAFQLNTNYNNDPITCIGFLQVSDQSTEIGALIVATESAIYTYRSQDPRDTWEAGRFGSVFIFNAGVIGPRAFENLNSDFFYKDADGKIRSAAMSRDEQKTWSKTPISNEVKKWLVVHDRSLLQYSFIRYFNNKLFISTNPFRTVCQGINNERLPDYASAGMVVLELDNISTLGKNSPPTWAGLWTGVRPMDMVVCNKRCFVMSKDAGINQLYEFKPTLTYDRDGTKHRYIRSKIYTREYDFNNSDFNNKSLHSLDLKLKNIRGDFSVNIRYRPEHAEKYIQWRSFSHNAPWRNRFAPFLLEGYEPHPLKDINIGSPINRSAADPVSKLPYPTFRTVQLELTLEGIYWELESFKVKATQGAQSENVNSCPEFPSVSIETQRQEDWSYGGFETCQVRAT